MQRCRTCRYYTGRFCRHQLGAHSEPMPNQTCEYHEVRPASREGMLYYTCEVCGWVWRDEPEACRCPNCLSSLLME